MGLQGLFMKERIIFIGTVLLISNIALASSTVVLVPEQARTTTQERKSRIQKSIVALLCARGLDRDVALERTASLLHAQTDDMVENVTKELDITKESVEAYLANKVLFKQPHDLSNYGDLIAMVQEIKKEVISEDIRERLIQVSQLNSVLVSA